MLHSPRPFRSYPAPRQTTIGPLIQTAPWHKHGTESGLTERIGGKKKESSRLRRHPKDSDAELFGFSLVVHNGTVLPKAQQQVTFDGVALT
jgi:hypothetical protein